MCARRHAKKLPDFNHKPGQPFRFAKTRLDDPRPIVLQLDDEEAKRLLWPGYAEIAPPDTGGFETRRVLRCAGNGGSPHARKTRAAAFFTGLLGFVDAFQDVQKRGFKLGPVTFGTFTNDGGD